MNVHRRVFLALVLVVAGTGNLPAADDLTGIWSAQARTKGGLGAQWVFGGNGDVTVTFGALVDFTYVIEGNRITMTSALDPASRKDTLVAEFVIEGNAMTQTPVGATGDRRVLQRTSVPHADAHPIIGDWTYPHPTGPTSLMRYSGEGIVQLSVPFQTMKGTYRLNGNVLEVEMPGRPPATFDVSRDARTLVLTERGAESKVRRFTKFEY